MDVIERDDDGPVVAIVHITDTGGVLLGHLELTVDDLRHPSSIGNRVIEELPSALRPHCRSHDRFAVGCCACADLNHD